MVLMPIGEEFSQVGHMLNLFVSSVIIIVIPIFQVRLFVVSAFFPFLVNFRPLLLEGEQEVFSGIRKLRFV